MFADETDLKLGDTVVHVKRLTLREIRAERQLFATGKIDLGAAYDDIVREHCSVAGKPLDPNDLTMRQMQTLVTELVGIPEGSGISDFIGLLC